VSWGGLLHYAPCGADVCADAPPHLEAAHLRCRTSTAAEPFDGTVLFDAVFDRPVFDRPEFAGRWPGPIPMTLESAVEYVCREYGAEVLWMRRCR